MNLATTSATHSAIRNATSRMPTPPPVVVVGGANLDLHGMASADMRLGESNPGQLRSTPGGVARNIAERLAQLGQPVRLVSLLGDDDAGHLLLAQGRAAGIDMAGCTVLPGHATARYCALHQPDGELLVAVNDMAILQALTPARLQAELPMMQAAPAVVVDANLAADTLAALRSMLLAAPLSDAARASNTAPSPALSTGPSTVPSRVPSTVPIWADAVSAAKCGRLWHGHDRNGGLAWLHTLKPNRLEALQLSGLPTDCTDLALARWLLDAGLQQVALSLGARGLLLAGRDARGGRWHHHAPAPAGPVHNVTGAGDALLAGLLHAQLAGWSAPAAAAFAVACAARALAGLALAPFSPTRADAAQPFTGNRPA